MNTTATTRTSTATSSTDDHLRQGFPTATIDSPRLTMQTAGWILGVVVAVGVVAGSAAVLGAAHSVDSANRRLAATSTLTTPDSVDSANRRLAATSTLTTPDSVDSANRRLAATSTLTTPDSVDSANRRTASTTDTHSSTDAAARRQ